MSTITDPRLDAAPLREFMLHDGRDGRAISELTGVSDRTIRAVMKGERSLVYLGTADRIVTGLDGVFCLVYPLEDGR